MRRQSKILKKVSLLMLFLLRHGVLLLYICFIIPRLNISVFKEYSPEWNTMQCIWSEHHWQIKYWKVIIASHNKCCFSYPSCNTVIFNSSRWFVSLFQKTLFCHFGHLVESLKENAHCWFHFGALIHYKV